MQIRPTTIARDVSRSRGVLGLCLVAWIGVAGPALAQIDGSSVDVSISAGYGFFEKWLGIEDDLLLAGRIGYNPTAAWGLDLGVDAVSSTASGSAGEVSSTFHFISTGYIANLLPVKSFSPYFSAAVGWAQLSVGETEYNSFGLGLMAGCKYRFGKHFGAKVEIKDVLARFRDSNTQTWLLTVGVTGSFGNDADDDGDGVGNTADRCPETPRGAVVNSVGCPSDSDGDGVPEGIDMCPETPRGVPVDERGCPRRR